MSTIGKRTIYVGPAGVNQSKPLMTEGLTAEAIRPGEIVRRDQSFGVIFSDNTAATVFAQDAMFADKNELQSRSVDDAYAQGEQIYMIRPRSGEYLNVLVAAGEVVQREFPLVRNGADGLLSSASATDGSEQIIAYADETILTPLAEDTLVRVRFA